VEGDLDKVIGKRDRQDLCLRCGQCCQQLHLSESPQELKDAYNRFEACGEEEPRYAEISAIFPMLEFVARDESDPLQPYLYRCKNLFKEGSTGLYSCKIHSERPYLCQGFPFYERFGNNTCDEGPVSPYLGCGYNR
jgi:Fe-S-cluster containining protein